MSEPQPITLEIDITKPKPDSNLESENANEMNDSEDWVLVQSIFPDRDIDYFLKVVAQKYNIEISELDVEDRGYASYLLRSYNYARKNLAKKLSEFNCSIDDKRIILTSLLEIEKKRRHFIGKSLFIEPNDILYKIEMVSDAQDAQWYSNATNKWLNYFSNQFSVADFGDEKLSKLVKSGLDQILAYISGYTISPRPKKIDLETRDAIVEALTQVYTFLLTLLDKQEMPVEQVQAIIDNFTAYISRMFYLPDPANQIKLFFEIFQAILKHNRGIDFIKDTTGTVADYTCNHGLSKIKENGFEINLLPALIDEDPDVAILIRGGNIWGMRRGDFGIGDFIVHSYVSLVTPQTLNELLLASKTIPTFETAKFEQNRLDALAMMIFGIMRDFIHDERPGVHEVISAMIDYYEADSEDKLMALGRLKNVLSKIDGYVSRQRNIFDLSKYDEIVSVKKIGGGQEKELVINVLKRLKENTAPTPELPPITKDEKLNKLLIEYREHSHRDKLESLLSYFNQKVLRMVKSKQIGTTPNLILAISWIDRKIFQFLNSLSYEDQVSLYLTPVFKEILMFVRLVYSADDDFDENEFVQHIAEVSSERFFIQAYGKVGKALLKSVDKLAKVYKLKGKNLDTDSLWSGNSVDALLSLAVELKPAYTPYGKKHREEWLDRMKDVLGDEK